MTVKPHDRPLVIVVSCHVNGRSKESSALPSSAAEFPTGTTPVGHSVAELGTRKAVAPWPY